MHRAPPTFIIHVATVIGLVAATTGCGRSYNEEADEKADARRQLADANAAMTMADKFTYDAETPLPTLLDKACDFGDLDAAK